MAECVVVQQNEPFFGAGHFDDRVEHRFEQRLDVLHRHQLFAELVEFAERRELLVSDLKLAFGERIALGRVRRPADGRRFVEHAERQFDVAERQSIAVHEPRPALLPPVDQDLAVLVDLFEVEVPTIEQYLRVRLGKFGAGEGHIISESTAHRRNGLVEHERARRTLSRKPLQKGHRGNPAETGWTTTYLKNTGHRGLSKATAGAGPLGPHDYSATSTCGKDDFASSEPKCE